MSLFSFCFGRIFSLDIELWVNCLLAALLVSGNFKTAVPWSSGLHCIWWEINHQSYCYFFTCVSPSGRLKHFLFNFGFPLIILMWLGVVLFVVILFGVDWDPWISDWCFLLNWGDVCHYFSCVFLPHLCLLLWDSSHLYVKPLYIIPKVTNSLHGFFLSF